MKHPYDGRHGGRGWGRDRDPRHDPRRARHIGAWHHLHLMARHDPDARAAVHGWLREFEARMYYGLDGRWSWWRGRHALGQRLTLLFVALALTVLLLAHWVSNPAWLIGGVVLASALAYLLVRRMLRPLWLLGLGVAAFGRGDLAQRIPVRRRDEIGALAARFNQMADDIVGMLDAKRALLLAISHELRSPITRARLNTELLPDGPERDALVQDLGLMRDLVEALIERERLDAGHSALLLVDADWPAWIDALVDKRFAASRAAGDLIVAIEPNLPAMQADRMRMDLLLANLLDNALRHNERVRGPVTLSLGRVGDGLRLEVRDFGSGVPDEALEQMGQPFYRPDASRSRAGGGVGLGLSLCKLIAAAHRAAFEIRNAGPGLAASVTFPLGVT